MQLISEEAKKVYTWVVFMYTLHVLSIKDKVHVIYVYMYMHKQSVLLVQIYIRIHNHDDIYITFI